MSPQFLSVQVKTPALQLFTSGFDLSAQLKSAARSEAPPVFRRVACGGQGESSERHPPGERLSGSLAYSKVV